ncbi:Vms1/Ankzf1 family peptidyl-tRNA hydrolase [Halorhabdus salina]|uniref:Vms1/Ankzf1 family peptidyl-tRNA hydrolase n=1 Tax=Halorhabdus salina TaxID=2750670 RepID=UPI0015EF4472|nr:Vms1/Ankzf1 family peptidyl-tRNA hydrolase [Halorhabdus salina]
MLDELLGRAALKERIEELEADKEDLQHQLAAESDRRADAVTKRQAAQRDVNELEDKVEQLKDRVERLQDTDRDLSVRRRERLHGDRLSDVLDRFESIDAGPDGALTAFVANGAVPPEIREAFGERSALVAENSPCFVLTDDAGVCSVALDPPITPMPFVEWGADFDIDRSLFEPTGEFTLALVRSDLFAMGEYRGRERVAFHGFDSDLGRNHSKGGFSQARFERLREEQIDNHLDRCRAALDERTTDRLYVVGERSILSQVASEADATAAVDATGDPEDALEDAFWDFWTTTLYAI